MKLNTYKELNAAARRLRKIEAQLLRVGAQVDNVAHAARAEFYRPTPVNKRRTTMSAKRLSTLVHQLYRAVAP